MAAPAPPVLVGAGTAAFESTAGATFTPSLPPGWARNDVLLLLFVHAATGALAAPTGWTQLAAQDNTAGLRTELWWKRAGSAETPPILQLSVPAVTTIRGARILALRGCPTDRSPFESIAVQVNSVSAVVGLPVGGSAASQELALALVAYAEDPFNASTMPGWTQPAQAVQGYAVDPWSGSFTVDSADPDVPSGGSPGPGAALLYQHRTLPTAGAAGTGTITVSGGTFAPAVSTSILLLARPAPTASLQTAIRARVLSTHGGPALARARALLRTVGAKLGAQVAALRVGARIQAAGLRAGQTAVRLRGAARAQSTATRASAGPTQPQARSRSVVVSLRTPFFSNTAAPSVRFRAQSTAVSALSPGPLPVKPLRLIDLGEIYRGDTVRLPTWVAMARNGLPIDLGGVTLRFTAKLDLGLTDAEPTTINASTEDGSIAVLSPSSAGRYRVTIPATETQALEIDGAFTFDVQLSALGSPQVIHTIEYGTLLVIRDVTRTPA
jgi:hypothetical protein